MSDKDLLRKLMAHPDYWTNEAIRQEADRVGNRLWRTENIGRKIIVSLNGLIVLQGTAVEISKRSCLTDKRIRQLAKEHQKDKYGKLYQYEVEESESIEI